MKKIILVNPPYPLEDYPSPPLGLMSLGAYLKKEKNHVIIEDYVIRPYSFERVIEKVKTFKPVFVGATAATMNVNAALKILFQYKKADKDIVTIMGGPHVTFDADNILKENSHIDFIVRGEGELTLSELAEAPNIEACSEIQGISYRTKGKIVHNKDRPLIEDINVLPGQDISLVEVSKYKALGLPVNMITSRGCPYKCVFCAGRKMGGQKIRYYNVTRVVDEFEALSKIGTKQINIADDLFTSNKKRCIEICREINRRGIKHKWTAFARVDTVSGELLEALKKAGCTTLCFGIESGNQQILDRINKKTDISMCRNAVRLCREAGIEPMTSYILGLPGETPETVKETLALSKSLSSNYGYHLLSPFPGTEVREKCREYGIRILSNNWDEYNSKNAVSESLAMPHKELLKIVNSFREGIDNYVKSIIEQYNRGEKISGREEQIVKEQRTFIFAKDLILGRIIENYPDTVCKNEKDNINILVKYITKKTGHSSSTVEQELKGLIENRCLVTGVKNNRFFVKWA